MPDRWPMRQARDHLSEVVDLAMNKGPQTITRRGKDAVVVMSLADYAALRRSQETLIDFFRRSPLVGSGVVFDRQKDPPRLSPEFH